MNLLISNNIRTIQKIKEYENCDVALSAASALIKIKSNKYDRIISDGINIKTPNVISVKEYLKEKQSSASSVKIFKQKIISVWSVKGGTGKTTVVKKLAEMLDKNIKILIVDLNFQDGGSDLSYMLDLPVIPHIGMWLKDKTEQSLLDKIIPYKQNVFILQSPPKRSLVQNINKNDIDILVKYARSSFDVIIFDLPNEYNEIVESALEHSTKKIIVSRGFISEAKRIKELNDDFIVFVNSNNKSWKPFFSEFKCYETKDIEKILTEE